jgi:ABC-2 type transport system ATP-binding protein
MIASRSVWSVVVSEPAVVVERLQKRYGAQAEPAVDDLSFDVAPGEVYGLLGVNGSGKSTTVGVLATLLAPTSGSARVLGHDVVAEPNIVRRNIGVTLQEAGVDPAATGRELLLLHGHLLGLTRREGRARASELLGLVDLADAADRRLRTYSGGMRRRLDLALALVGRPGVLFLDEPTTGLDPLSRQALWAEIRRLRSEGTTILLTTQYLDEADQLADRVGILDDGRMRLEGTPDDLKRGLGGDVVQLEVEPAHTDRAAAAIGAEPERPGHLSLRVAGGGAALPTLIEALQKQGVPVLSISLTRPTLDDVFIDVVGRPSTEAA